MELILRIYSSTLTILTSLLCEAVVTLALERLALGAWERQELGLACGLAEDSVDDVRVS